MKWAWRASVSLAASLCTALLAAQTVTATIPNGRLLTPVGDWVQVAPFPFAMSLRPDGQQLVAASLGFPFALNVINNPSAADRSVTQVPKGFLSTPGVEVYAGVVFAPGGRQLYVATGDSGSVDLLAADDWHKLARISLNGPMDRRAAGRIYQESFAGALLLSPDGRTLYVIDQANWRVAVIDTATTRVVASVATGVNPLALCLSPDGKRLYVANSGLFEYKTIPGARDADRLHTGLHFPSVWLPLRSRAPWGYRRGTRDRRPGRREQSSWQLALGQLT